MLHTRTWALLTDSEDAVKNDNRRSLKFRFDETARRKHEIRVNYLLLANSIEWRGVTLMIMTKTTIFWYRARDDFDCSAEYYLLLLLLSQNCRSQNENIFFFIWKKYYYEHDRRRASSDHNTAAATAHET